jgi:hypothetical protein
LRHGAFFCEKLCFIKSKDFLHHTQTNKPSSEVQMYDQLHKRPNRLLI